MPRDVPSEVLSTRETVNQVVHEKISPIQKKLLFLWNCFAILVTVIVICYL